MTVLIAGGGIGGLTLALSLHQIGVPAKILDILTSHHLRDWTGWRGSVNLYPSIAATASISISQPGRASLETTTSVEAGGRATFM
jgi:2-polyprenyl-6-methoxyphenol hydroxylase-like FAD-dependent oxidoreductase